jgi:hypothetical protein
MCSYYARKTWGRGGKSRNFGKCGGERGEWRNGLSSLKQSSCAVMRIGSRKGELGCVASRRAPLASLARQDKTRQEPAQKLKSHMYLPPSLPTQSKKNTTQSRATRPLHQEISKSRSPGRLVLYPASTDTVNTGESLHKLQSILSLPSITSETPTLL